MIRWRRRGSLEPYGRAANHTWLYNEGEVVVFDACTEIQDLICLEEGSGDVDGKHDSRGSRSNSPARVLISSSPVVEGPRGSVASSRNYGHHMRPSVVTSVLAALIRFKSLNVKDGSNGGNVFRRSIKGPLITKR